jgi:hypothetical protein
MSGFTKNRMLAGREEPFSKSQEIIYTRENQRSSLNPKP